MEGARPRGLAVHDRLALHFHEPWLSGMYTDSEGVQVASVRADGRNLEITDESGHRAMTIMRYRDARSDRASAQPSLPGGHRLGLRARFALVANEIVGVLRPYP